MKRSSKRLSSFPRVRQGVTGGFRNASTRRVLAVHALAMSAIIPCSQPRHPGPATHGITFRARYSTPGAAVPCLWLAEMPQFIKKFGRTCFDDGIQYKCENSRLSEMWGNRLVRDKGNLLPKHANSSAQFDVNDEGYIVAVGTGNTWRDGVAKNLWGTTVTVDGTSYPWGRPILQRDANNQLTYGRIGESQADLNVGFNNHVPQQDVRFYFHCGPSLARCVQPYQPRSTIGDAPVVEASSVLRDELKKDLLATTSIDSNSTSL